MIWFVFAVLTGLAVVSVLWPLLSPVREEQEHLADAAFDPARRSTKSTPRCRAERPARRRAPPPGSPPPGVCWRARGTRPPVRFAARQHARRGPGDSVDPRAVAGALQPDRPPRAPDQPLQARLDQPLVRADRAEGAEIESRLARQPDSGADDERLAPIYLREGRYAEAVQARAKPCGCSARPRNA